MHVPPETKFGGNMRGFFIVLLAGLAALTGCKQKSASSPADAVQAADCGAQAVSSWEIAAGQVYEISATSAGPDCAKAVIALAVRGPDGNPLFVAATKAQDSGLAFNGAQGRQDMQARLQDWIAPAQAGFTTSADLPAWPEGATGPAAKPAEGVSGTFPFYPEAEAYGERAGYEALRSAKAPVFCYVQGPESFACLAAQDGSVFPIGLQVFPG